jgi:gliding motility-associated-like protein
MKKAFLLMFIFLILQHLRGEAQDYSNKGTDFWIPYAGHIDSTSSRMALYISSDNNTTGQVELAGNIIPFSVVANQAATIEISPAVYAVYNGQSDGIGIGKGIHVISVKPIVVYAHILNQARSGSSLVLPTNVLGRDYIALAYTQSTNNVFTAKSQITIVGVENNTLIEIKPVATDILTIHPANIPFLVTLNKGDVYQYQSFIDLTGSSIKSVSNAGIGCKPIAVFTGSTWTSFNCANASGGDNLYQQLFPIGTWGKNFVTAPFANRESDIFRIIVKDPATIVTLNGIVLNSNTLHNGIYYEYQNANGTANAPLQISADKPIEVIQYMTSLSCDSRNPAQCPNNKCPFPGDPEIVTINPLEQTISNVTVVSARKDLTPPNTNIDYHYINVIMKTAFTGSLKIDNASPAGSWTPIPNSLYSYLQEDVTNSTLINPSHNIHADDGFIAIAYGMGWVESYGYNAGTNVRDFTQSIAFQNPYKRIDSAITCVNTPFKFSFPLNFIPSSIKWDFSAAPNIVPNTTYIPPSSPVLYDSATPSINPILYYFSPPQTYQFTHSNTTALRDTIKLYTTSSTPDGCGSLDQLFQIPVKVLDLPHANFTTNNSGCLIDSVHFFDATNTNGESIVEKAIWDFGDNTFDSILNPVKKYLISNTYLIRFRPITNYGCIGDTTIRKSFTDFPLAQFTVVDGCKNQAIKITDQSNAVTGSTIVKWYWDYGNGTKDTLTTNQSRSITYSDTGTVTISLIVESNSGCLSKVFKKSIQIKPLPDPGFILPEVCQNDAVTQFFDTSRISDNSNNFTYEWNFNAGIPGIIPGPVPITISDLTAKNPKVTYTKPANYIVTEKVTSAAGCAITLSQPFTVNGSNPNPDFEVLNSNTLCSNQVISIRNKSTMLDFGNVTRLDIYWDTNDLTKKTSIETPYFDSIYRYTYSNFQSPASKNYTIRLVAFSGAAASCNKSIEKVITVFQSPKVSFSAIPGICSNDQPRFIKEASYDTNVPNAIGSPFYSGNGITNSLTGLFDPSITGAGGPFIIKYVSISDRGCSDSLSQSIVVSQTPVLELGPNKVVLENGQVTIIPQIVQGNNLQYIWSPPTYLNSHIISEPISSPKTDITYQLLVTGDGNCTATDSISVKVLFAPLIPNAFSPNGDGVNDTWKIQYLESYPGATIDVFNRYGQKVFASVGYQTEWDGNFNGKPLPVAVYYYIINPKNGRPIFSGSVTIIK